MSSKQTGRKPSGCEAGVGSEWKTQAKGPRSSPPCRRRNTLGLEIRALAGANIAVETASDLSTWTESQHLPDQVLGNSVKLILQPDPNVQAKF